MPDPASPSAIKQRAEATGAIRCSLSRVDRRIFLKEARARSWSSDVIDPFEVARWNAERQVVEFEVDIGARGPVPSKPPIVDASPGAEDA
jgi:hypothetical protein